MKSQQFFLLFLMISVVMILSASLQLNMELQPKIHVTQLEIVFNGTNATATVDYDLNFFTQLYIFFFGNRNLDPLLNDFLYGFEEFQIDSIQGTTATAQLTNVSRYTGSIYLHDSRPFSSPVDELIYVYPEGEIRSYKNVTATRNTFY